MACIFGQHLVQTGFFFLDLRKMSGWTSITLPKNAAPSLYIPPIWTPARTLCSSLPRPKFIHSAADVSRVFFILTAGLHEFLELGKDGLSYIIDQALCVFGKVVYG